MFSISALDLFASALGAFILMSLIFMVFFSMTSRDSGEAEETRTALERCEAELASVRSQLDQAEARNAELEERLSGSVGAESLEQCQSELEETRAALTLCQAELQSAGGVTERLQRANEELEACQRALQKTFVLVIASWSSRDDVDLHVVDPAGREFYYRERRRSGSQAALEEDNTRGPGNEVWLHPSAEPGRYRVCYKLYSGSPSPSVRGSILWQEGKLEIPNLALTREGQVRIAVEVLVGEDGRIRLDRSRTGEVVGAADCQ